MTSLRPASISASCIWLWILVARSSNRNANTRWLNRRNPAPNLFPPNRQDVDATFRQNQAPSQGSQAPGETLRRWLAWARPAPDLPVLLEQRTAGERACARSDGTADRSQR